MQLNDILFTPLYLVAVYIVAYSVRPFLTTNSTRKYFIPALTLKIIGGLSVGLIYFYFYEYGDTLRYHFFSQIIHDKIWDDPSLGLKMLLSSYDSEDYKIVYHLTDNYFFKRDAGGFFMLKITAVLGLLSQHSYFTIAVLYAFISFFGLWALYNILLKVYPKLHLEFFIAVFCIPSVFFWGSGILKDTITLSAIGWLMHSSYYIMIKRRVSVTLISIFVVSVYMIVILKVYIVLCFFPGILLWITSDYTSKIKNRLLKYMASPLIIFAFGFIAFLFISNVSTYDLRYSMENLESTMKVTATWITYTSGELGSAYSLGDDFDLSLIGILKKLPAGINVTLFRPYLWEVKNIVMLFAAIESMLLMLFTIYVFYKVGFISFFRILFNGAMTKFLFIYSLSFSFAVGITTYNFGSLVRYKIPGIPFYLVMLFIVLHIYSSNKINGQTVISAR